METQKYYNAKPSKITNIGIDVHGAKRMYFDTYETTEEKEAKAKRKVIDNKVKDIKEQIKAQVLSDTPNREKLIELLCQAFEFSYGFSALADNARAIILARRQSARSNESTSEFNKMVRAYNSLLNDVARLKHERYASYYLSKMRKRYEPKNSFTEQSGETLDWKDFEVTKDIKDNSNFLSHNSRAVQFGNSVSDKERLYICKELSDFITKWHTDTRLNSINLIPLAWSFGARGKAGSVAYYQSGSKLISVNRNNIGSLIHEIGHYIDDIKGTISRKISYATVNNYRETIKEGLSNKELYYYCKREEIFARAFEAYCYSITASFKPFAQAGKSFLPELNDELLTLINEALKDS